MARKRASFRQNLWGAWVWLASHFLHIFYLAAKAIIWAVGETVARLSKAASHAASSAAISQAKPKSGASYSPLILQQKQSGSLSEFEEKVLSQQSTVGLILGARGSGKSALGMRLLENAHARTGRKACAMGFDPSTLPQWIAAIDEPSQAPNGSFVLVDEGGISFSSRSSMSAANKLLSSLVFVSRHKDLSVLFISQNSANLEVNAIRQADYLLLRKPSLLQKDFERKRIAEIYEKAGEGFSRLPQAGRHSTYIYSDEFRGFAANSLPSFWSSRASKPFSSFPAKGKGG